MQFLEAETKGQDAGEASWCKSRGVMEPWWFTRAAPKARFAASEAQHYSHDHKTINNNNKNALHAFWLE